MDGQHYCLRWNNYQTNMTSVFHQLLQSEAFVDVTLACNDLSLKAHKVVLSACSSYFQKLLLENPCKHPTIIMPQDVCYADLKFIIEFVYKGEIDVSQAELQSLLKTADQLKIKGLCEPPEDEDENSDSPFPFVAREYPKLRRLSSPLPQQQQQTQQTYQQQQQQQQNGQEQNNRKHRYRKQEKIVAGVGGNQEGGSVTGGGGGVGVETEESEKSVTEVEETEKEDKEIAKETVEEGSQEGTTDEGGEVVVPPAVANEERRRKQVTPVQNKPLNMSSNAIMAGQMLFSQFGVDTEDFPPDPPAPTATPVGHVEMHDHSPTRTLLTNSSLRADQSDSGNKYDIKKEGDVKFETLRNYEQESLLDIESSRMSGPDHSMDSHDDSDHSIQHHASMMVTPELMSMMPGVSHRLDHSLEHSLKSNGHGDSMHSSRQVGPKTWTQDDMELALDALRNHNMSLTKASTTYANPPTTKASATYGIPSTTLWQRAHRLGIDTPKKEGPSKSWTEENLNSALEALRTGTISANKASKAYGIPSSTLYKIARREGIRLAAPFNAAPTTWTPEDLEKALESIRSGQTSVQRASTEYGIPTGTLYGRCKREGIELSRSNPTPWSEDAMGEALEAVRLGHMSINQAAIHYNLPYSSLYGRFKRGIKYSDSDPVDINTDSQSHQDTQSQSLSMLDYTNSHHQVSHYQNQPPS